MNLDYIDTETGLLMCGNCHTPKQRKYELVGKILTFKSLCKCEQEQKEKEEKLAEKIKFDKKVNELRKIAFSEEQMKNWNFENDDRTNKKLSTIAKNYVDNFDKFYKEGKGLLLHGGVGTGKTYIACMIANALIDKGMPVLVTNFSKILNILQGTFEKQEYLDSLKNFDLLVIDDLGIERDTGYAKEQVYSIIDTRYRTGLPMIITTNFTLQKLVTETDLAYKRVYDRILEKCYPVEVAGESRRIKKLLNSNNDMKNILGI